MGYVPPRPPAPLRHQYREQTAKRLDTASDETFARWMELPPNDRRTIEEFAADAGRRAESFDFEPGALIDLRPLRAVSK